MPTSRKLESFINTFTSETANTGSPTVFRRWTAIATIAAAVKQNVWVKTRHALYPNLYTILVAHPGVGKTRIINECKHLAATAEVVPLAPISVTFAALIDFLGEQGKIELIRKPEGTIKYNSALITADEMGAFIHKYDSEMINGLSALYDPTVYSQERRTGDLKLKIERPQINILAGATPQFLLSFMPEDAWGQGFTSRLILVFSDQRIIVDDFADHGAPQVKALTDDLKTISSLYGQFTVTDAYRSAVNDWKASGEPPVPSHPRLVHYITRRRVNIYKLSMVSSIDRDDSLCLTEADFFTALEWLVTAETTMPDIFKAGSTNADSMAMDDILHWIQITDFSATGVSEQRIVQYASQKLPIQSVTRVIEILENSGQITSRGFDKRTGVKRYSVTSGSASLPATDQSVVSLKRSGIL